MDHADRMTRSEIVTATATLLAEHGLHDWTVTISDRMVATYGACLWSQREIRISAQLAAVNPRSETIDTIKHEVAHAIAGKRAGHGIVWRKACELTGARPEACYGDNVISPTARYDVICSGCHDTVAERNRRPSRKFYHLPSHCLPGLERDERELQWVPKLED